MSRPRNLVVVVLDSLRYDAWIAADPPNLKRLGKVERRWSYATWTAPSHYNLLMGLLPHTSPPNVYASEYYKEDFRRYGERLGIEEMGFKRLLPSLFLPTYLKHSLGYRTHARVSMPVLNPETIHQPRLRQLQADADPTTTWRRCSPSSASTTRRRRSTSSTSARRTTPTRARTRTRASGRASPASTASSSASTTTTIRIQPREFFDQTKLNELQARQIDVVGYVDGVFAQLFDLLPDNTWVIVTSDHGELFGEQRYFGHGPIMHEKVLEVPFVEGPAP